jgi:hypothetical protein
MMQNRDQMRAPPAGGGVIPPKREAMFNASMSSANISLLAIQEIGQTRHTEESAHLSLIPWARARVGNPRGVLAWFFARVTDYLVGKLDRRANRLTRHAIFFEGAKISFADELAATKRPPSAELIDHLEQFLRKNKDALQSCDDAIRELKRINPTSRMSFALDRMRVELLRVHEAVSGLLEVANYGLHHHLVRERVLQLQSLFDQQLDEYMEDQDFDPELIALADAALARISSSRVSAR